MCFCLVTIEMNEGYLKAREVTKKFFYGIIVSFFFLGCARLLLASAPAGLNVWLTWHVSVTALLCVPRLAVEVAVAEGD
jgi:hypothetical protein